jgi:hypothetical protein
VQFKWVESTGTRNLSSKNLPKINEFYKNGNIFTKIYQNLNKREDVSRGKREERGKG